MKKCIIFYILGIVSAISVVFANNILTSADIISYDDKTVADALDDLLGKADAKEEDLLVGKTAYVNGELLTGTMPNVGTITKELSLGESFTIPKGYHSGNGVITSNGQMIENIEMIQTTSGTSQITSTNIPKMILVSRAGTANSIVIWSDGTFYKSGYYEYFENNYQVSISNIVDNTFNVYANGRPRVFVFS